MTGGSLLAVCLLLCPRSAVADPILAPAHECLLVPFLLGARQAAYRIEPRLPVLDTRKKIKVVVYASGYATTSDRQIPKYLAEAHETLDRAGKPGLEIVVVDVSTLDSREKFTADLRKRSEGADVILFSGHANPGELALTETFSLKAEHFSGVDLSGKTVILGGCNTGTCVWTPDLFAPQSVNLHLMGTRVDTNLNLVTGTMTRSNPSYVIGTTRPTDNTGSLDMKRLIQALFVDGGNKRLEGYRVVASARKGIPRLDDTLDGTLRLKTGNTAQKIRYLDQVEAWRDHGYHVDLTVLLTIDRWLAEKDLSPKLRARILDFLFDREGMRLRELAKTLPQELRLNLLKDAMASPEFAYRVHDYADVLGMLAKGDSEAMEKLVKAIPEWDRMRIFMRSVLGSSDTNPEFLGALAKATPTTLDPIDIKGYRLAALVVEQKTWWWGGMSVGDRTRALVDPRFVPPGSKEDFAKLRAKALEQVGLDGSLRDHDRTVLLGRISR